MKVKKVFDRPVEDCELVDPTEVIVALWFQLEGVYHRNKQMVLGMGRRKETKRAHIDRDVLAVNGEETVIVNVTQNLDDKITRLTKGNFDVSNIELFFNRVLKYLESVKEYRWLLNRKLRKVLVYNYGNPSEELQRYPSTRSIELVNFKEMLSEILSLVKEEHLTHGKITNRLLRLILETERLRMIN